MKFVNSELGKAHRLRGLNAKVIRPGVVSVGDRITKGGA
jgi:MOSC domain-containing protein YiiM